MTRAYTQYGTRQTPQSEAIPRSTQVVNSASGFAWEVSDREKLDRFLILGSEGGTYYIGRADLTRQNAEAVQRCIAQDGPRTIRRIVEISQGGRAPKNDPAIFALALAAAFGDLETKRLAGNSLPDVCRIGTHLFHFAQYVEQFRGWGRSLKRSVRQWYEQRPVGSLALQTVKYQQRDGWSHRDLLRLAHPVGPTTSHKAVYDWAVGRGTPEPIEGAELIWAFTEAQKAAHPSRIAELIREYKLPREAIPTEALNDPAIWEALLEDMPMMALIRNLAKMTSIGLLQVNSAAVLTVSDRIADMDALRRARIHPVQVLAALLTYAAGKGFRGSLTWNPVPRVIDSLDAAFYATFGQLDGWAKRLVVGLDVSGSMHGTAVNGIPFLGCQMAAGAMAMCFVQPTSGFDPVLMSFDTGPHALSISRRQRLDDVTNTIANSGNGGTDCAQPIIWALENKIEADVFVVLTDSESWYGSIHPAQAIQNYRQRMGIQAKLITVAMASNSYTISDENDAGMMDCVGFDTATPGLISEFANA